MLTTRTPILENGDRMNRFEFEKRYAQMSENKKVELINGVVYMPAALRYKGHGFPHSLIITWLGLYVAQTPGVEFAGNTTVRLDSDNEPQPDALLRIKSELGGQSRISNDDYIEGAPELIVEISGSTVSYDLHDKLNVYRRHGVKEYIVWRVYDQQIDWFYLDQGEYKKLAPDNLGLIASQEFPGLVLSVNALLTENLAEVLAELGKNLQSPNHQSFLEKLHQKNI
ncbi:MAG: Uma2 family endonuclease [Sphaerospermopsis sp. SIO1G2]|nr:Uma2 family endonuclease [Sphaerospermopsis sp. SIO1G1]NET73261.1 Uma2 family endonuclease [Sphaerospermopsis sp. SIO1G2]